MIGIFKILKTIVSTDLVVVEADATGLKYKIKPQTKEHRAKGWGVGEPIGGRFFQYYCPSCEGELTPGPSGGGTNQVCETCRVNYGCLPGALDR